MDGDFSAPAFTASPDKEVTVLIKQQTSFKLSFTATDDRQLDYVLINIPGVEGYADKKVDAGGQSSLTHTEKFALPNVAKSYNITLKAVDKKGNETVTTSVLNVSEMPDFPKMYLADVATVEELNSDVFGVPMVISHTGAYQYRARYYNETAGTKIFFLPQRPTSHPSASVLTRTTKAS